MNTQVNEAALSALKRQIRNILSSYVGWYDPFAELIQNALDSVEGRVAVERSAGTQMAFRPQVRVLIDLDANMLTVTDNGVGLDKEKFEQFLAPNFSFKSGATRGHKGVGATFVAYGFNYMRISTKVPGFQASGRIINARTWINENATGANPKVEPDDSPVSDDAFDAFDRGVSVTVRFDDNTHPRRLDWIQAKSADVWHKILRIKTAIGAITEDDQVNICVVVKCDGKLTEYRHQGLSYLWLHKLHGKCASLRDLEAASEALFRRHGASRALPDKYRNLDFIYDNWTSEELRTLIGSALEDDDKAVLLTYSPTVSVEYGYTAKLWTNFNETLKLRSNYRVLTAGIQLAANNMPQGETITIPLIRNIGRQNQIHFLIHFNKYSPDLGRKGFNRELTDFAKTVARSITENHLSKLRHLLKANTGVAPDLVREMRIEDWKSEMLAHETEMPLILTSNHFFLPTERVSITSTPTREQDVIALFHQLIAGGVIRGISIMSTNERFVYDGLYKVAFDLGPNLYMYDAANNPLGVPYTTAKELQGRITSPRILEYKFSLDGLIEDVDSHDKNIRDVDLCIVWQTGVLYKERYGITSLLVPENADQRQYHGITHVLTDLETGAKLSDLIVLSELVALLNDAEDTYLDQRAKYE